MEISIDDLENNVNSVICDRWGRVIWFQMLEKLRKYIVENKKRPSYKSKNPEIKKLGYWI